MSRMSIRSSRYRRPKNITWDLALEERTKFDPASYPILWDFSELFGRNAPVEIEIGFGRGRFLLAAAEKNPDGNWLGIEYVKGCVLLAAERAAKRELQNVRIVQGAAETILAEHIPDHSVAVCHVYFPDPWPKARHYKRRIFKPPFVAELRRILAPGGMLRVATDYTEYFDEIVPMVLSGGFTLVDMPDEIDDEAFRTNFEEKALRRGETIHRARFLSPA